MAADACTASRAGWHTYANTLLSCPHGECWPMVGGAAGDRARPSDGGLRRSRPRRRWRIHTRSAGDPRALARRSLNLCWRLTLHPSSHGCVSQAGHEFDVVGRHQAVSSRLHLNFASLQSRSPILCAVHATAETPSSCASINLFGKAAARRRTAGFAACRWHLTRFRTAGTTTQARGRASLLFPMAERPPCAASEKSDR